MRALLLLSLSLLIFVAACRKKAVCKGTCVDVRISGRIYNAVSNTGLDNRPLEVNWFHNGFCLFCSSYKLSTNKTDNNGYFDFIVSLDSSMFHQYQLNVRSPFPEGYINNGFQYLETGMYSYSANGLMNLQFPVYPQADLYIRLHRTLTDSFQYFTVDHSFVPNSTIGDFIVYSTQKKDTTLHVFSAAGVNTKIIWTKRTPAGAYIQNKDSLFCTKQGPNIFDIYY